VDGVSIGEKKKDRNFASCATPYNKGGGTISILIASQMESLPCQIDMRIMGFSNMKYRGLMSW
jgi:hypothetical protein